MVNFRLHPRDTIESITDPVRSLVENDPVKVRIRKRVMAEASTVSDGNGPGFENIACSVHEVYGNHVVVAPGLRVAATDSRRYGRIAKNSYRFTPRILHQDEIPQLYRVNERLSIDNLVIATRTYARLIEHAAISREKEIP